MCVCLMLSCWMDWQWLVGIPSLGEGANMAVAYGHMGGEEGIVGQLVLFVSEFWLDVHEACP